MTIREMSEEFNLIYNQVNSNQAPGIDEFEKSQFLTKAQDEIIKAYFDPRGNKFLEGFDNGQKRQYDFSLLVVNKTLDRCIDNVEPYDPRAFVYLMPNDLFLTLNESVVETSGNQTYIYQVIPITYEQYGVLMQKPYQYPTKRAVSQTKYRHSTKVIQIPPIHRMSSNNLSKRVVLQRVLQRNCILVVK